MVVDALSLCSLPLLSAPKMHSKFFFCLPVIVLQRVLFLLMFPSMQIHVENSVKCDMSRSLCAVRLYISHGRMTRRSCDQSPPSDTWSFFRSWIKCLSVGLSASLFMVLHTVQLECEKSVDLTASHCFCLLCSSCEMREKWLCESQSALGLGGRRDRVSLSRSWIQHDT